MNRGFRFCWLLIALFLPAHVVRVWAQADSFRGKTLRIGTDATYPPFESMKNGAFVGFDIELGEAIAQEMGAKTRWINTAFDGVFPALLAGKIDLVMSAVTITPERQKRLAFSQPYYLAGQIVAVRKNQNLSGLEALRGKTAGIQINTTASEVLKNEPKIGVRKYPTIDLALQDLQNGNLDGVVGDAPTIRYFLAHGFGQLKTVGAMLTRENYGIVMRPQDKNLQSEVNAALSRLRANGGYAALEEKYFGAAARAADAKSAKAGAGAFPLNDVIKMLVRGLAITLVLTLSALFIGLPSGLLIALGRTGGARALRFLCAVFVELLRGTPLLVQIIFVYYALPPLLGIDLPPMSAAILALSLNSAAYIAEIFRAGIGGVRARTK